MGVKDLWQLLSPIGRRISIESLEGKVLAIDMSIWITQFIKAMRDDDGKMIQNAHILGTLRRILRLLFHKIRPVFVFDGETPALKARIIQQRRKTHERHVSFSFSISNMWLIGEQESNRKAAVHKIILNQLKRRLLDSMKPPSVVSSHIDAFVSVDLAHKQVPQELGVENTPQTKSEALISWVSFFFSLVAW
jgi:DNA-binding transcriptional ArsR family regulator